MTDLAEYINREKAIDIIRKHWSRHDGDTACQKAIDELRTCEAEKVRPAKEGTWIELDNCMEVCSECGGLGCGSKYCPNCGAKMEGT